MKHLADIQTAGGGDFVRSVFSTLLIRIEHMAMEQDDGNVFRDQVEWYMTLLPCLAGFWREEAERVIDHIVNHQEFDGIDPGIMETALCRMSLLIPRHALTWSDGRRQRFGEIILALRERTTRETGLAVHLGHAEVTQSPETGRVVLRYAPPPQG